MDIDITPIMISLLEINAKNDTILGELQKVRAERTGESIENTRDDFNNTFDKRLRFHIDKLIERYPDKISGFDLDDLLQG